MRLRKYVLSILPSFEKSYSKTSIHFKNSHNSLSLKEIFVFASFNTSRKTSNRFFFPVILFTSEIKSVSVAWVVAQLKSDLRWFRSSLVKPF